MSNMSGMDYNSRVRAGKKLEAVIKKELQKLGIWVKDATSQEDMVDKIDGYINVGGKEASVQIKQRETKNDIIFEVYKDTTEDKPNGRDFNGRAQWYACRDTNGNLTVVPTANLKKVVRAFLKEHGKDITRPVEFMGVDFRNTTDNDSGSPKLMAFFPRSKYGYKL